MRAPFTLSSAMGPAVIKHLSQFGDLPARGILAGQAVDSALTDLYGGGGGVYNDLDVFRTVKHSDKRTVVRASGTAVRSEVSANPRCPAHDKEHEYEGLACLMELAGSYRIESVSRNDLVNYVNCSVAHYQLGGGLSALRVLSGFDLNCTRVAVDLATQTLYWDRHYEEFLASRQLQISMMYTPWHTFLRLLKKLRELPGVYADLDQAAMACTAVARSKWLGQMLKQGDVSLSFGKKSHELAQVSRAEWSPFFDLTSRMLYRQPSGQWANEPAASKDTSFETSTDGQTSEQATLWSLSPRGELDAQLQSSVNALGRGALFFSASVTQEHRRRKKPCDLAKLQAVKTATFPREAEWATLPFVNCCARGLGTSFVQGQALPSVALKVQAFVDKHRGFARLLTGLSLAQQWETISRVQGVCSAFGDQHFEGDHQAALGMLETGDVTAVLLERNEWMEQFLARSHARDIEPFSLVPLPLPKLPASLAHLQLRELGSALELRKEGRELRHCVGGYAPKVRQDQCRILSIRNPQQGRSDRSTLELAPRSRNSKSCKATGAHGAFELRIQQHHSFCNRQASQSHQHLAAYLLAYLGMTANERRLAGTPSGLKVLTLRAQAAQKRDLEPSKGALARQRFVELHHLETGR